MIWGGSDRKAQISIAIILGIVVLSIVTVLLVIRGVSTDVPFLAFFEGENADTKAVRAFVEQCISTEVGSAVRVMAAQGGFLFLTQDFVDIAGIPVPVAYENKKNMIVSKRQMSEQLALYMNVQIANCTDFTPFKNRGINVSPQTVLSSAIITRTRLIPKLIKSPATTIGASKIAPESDITRKLSIALTNINTNKKTTASFRSCFLSLDQQPVGSVITNLHASMIAFITIPPFKYNG